MRMSWNEIRARAARFAEEWKDAHYERGEAQTFYNEFFEVCRFHVTVIPANLVRAIEATFRRRRAVLPNELPIGLSIEFVSDAGKLSQWDAFVRRSRLDTKEIDLETVVKVIADFMMPASIAAAEGKAFLLRWTPGGPWQVR